MLSSFFFLGGCRSIPSPWPSNGFIVSNISNFGSEGLPVQQTNSDPTTKSFTVQTGANQLSELFPPLVCNENASFSAESLGSHLLASRRICFVCGFACALLKRGPCTHHASRQPYLKVSAYGGMMVLNEPLRDIESLEGLNPASNPIGIPVFFGPPSYLVFHPGFKSTFQQPDWLPLFGISIRAERLVQSMASKRTPGICRNRPAHCSLATFKGPALYQEGPPGSSFDTSSSKSKLANLRRGVHGFAGMWREEPPGK